MAEKNWLIRTRNKKLLGPVSKSKIRELLEKGSLAGDDELTMGNGYWFWVREKNLIEKYVFGGIDQDFNPVSEAPDSNFDLLDINIDMPAAEDLPPAPVIEEDHSLYPEEDDLEYPDMSASASFEVEHEEEEELIPSEEDLEYPDMDELDRETAPKESALPPPPSMEMMDNEVEAEPEYEEEYEQEYREENGPEDEVDATLAARKAAYIQQIKDSQERIDEESAPHEEEPAPKKQRNDRYLYLIIIILVVLIGFVLYLYYNLFNSPFPLVGINSAHAQTISASQSLSKKKVFLN